MPYFLKKRHGEDGIASGPASKSKKLSSKKQTKAKVVNNKVRNEATFHGNPSVVDDSNVLSDENFDDLNEEYDSEDSEYRDETAHEKRLRLAKQYLSEVTTEVKASRESDDEEDESALISKRLEDEVKDKAGRLFKTTAELLLEPKDDDITVLKGHKLTVTCVVISTDIKYIFSASKDCSIIKWNVATKKKAGIIHGGRKNTEHKHIGHSSHILCMAISSDDKFLVSGDLNRYIMVWNPATLERLHTFRTHRGAVTALAFRKNTHQLFSGSADRSVKLWSLDEMAYAETLFGHQDTILGIDAHVRERAITCGGRDSSVRIWKIVEETQLMYTGKGVSIECVCLLDEERFATGTDNNRIYIWNVHKKGPTQTLSRAHGKCDSNWISAVRCLKNTDLLASGSKDGQVKFWRASQKEQPRPLFSVPIPGFINDIQFSANGSFAVAAVGKEHRMGRWWKIEEAKNSVVIINLPRKKDTDVSSKTPEEQGTKISIFSK